MSGKREVVYDVQSKGFTGWVKIALLKYKERLSITRECNFDIQQSGKDVNVQVNQNNIKAMEKLMELVPKHVKGLEVIHQKSKKVAKDWEDIEYDADFDEISQEVAFVVLNGIKLGGRSGQV